MRKHFLLLFLMALLPLAGWAAADPVAPTAKTNLVYTGGDQQLVTAGVAETGDYYYAVVAKDADAPAYDVYTDDATAITGKNAGSYDVYFKALETAPAAAADVAGATKITVTIAKKLATVTINAAALAATSPVNYHRVYGWKPASFTDIVNEAAVDALVQSYSGFKDGTDEVAAKANIVVNWGNNVNAKGYYNAGEHTFTLSINSMPNYIVSLSPSTGKWYVDKKDLIISADATTTLTYGDVFDETTASTHVTYNGFVDDEDEDDLDGKLGFTSTYDAAVPAKSGVGTYSWSPSGQTSDNYNITYNNGIITMEEKDITDGDVTIAPFDNVTYNGGNQKPTAIKAGAFKDKTLAAADYTLEWYPTATIVEEVITGVTGTKITGDIKDADTYYAKITGKGNYEGVVYKAFTIGQAKLGIRTANLTKVYAATNYYGTATTATYSGDNTTVILDGLQGTDTKADALSADPTLSLEKDGTPITDGKAIDAGVYDIKLDLTGVTSTNYELQDFSVGKLTISKRVVKITAKDKSKKFGITDPYKVGVVATAADVTVATTPATEGILTGESHAITAYPMLKREGDEEKGSYRLYLDKEDEDHKLVIKKGENDVTANYDPQFIDGTFTIGEGEIGIWADTQTATYGITVAEAKAMLTATIIGMTADEITQVQDAVNAKVVLNVPAGLADGDKLPANKTGYTISFTDFEAADVIPAEILANYSSTINKYSASAKFIVNKAPLTLKVLNQSLIADETEALAPASEQTVEILTEGLSDADKTALFTTAATKISLKYSAKLVSGTDYVAATGKLKPNALTHGWDGENATTDGIYVNGIEIDDTNYKDAAVNYTLVLTGEDATVTPGTLYLSNGAYVTFDATATGDNLVSTKLAANNNKTIGVKVILRRDQTVGGNTVTWSAKQWNTMVLPFDISVADLSAALGYAIVNVVKPEATTGDKVKFQLEMDEIPANTPFAVKTTKAIANDQVIDFGVQTIKYEANPAVDAGADNIFHGAYTSMDITSANPEYRFCAGNVWPHISEAGSKFVVRPFNAYMEIDAANLARDIVFEFEELDGSTTSIKSVDFGSSKAYEADGWYTINGMKLNAAPTEKGIYINNGKKVVVK